MPRVSFLRRTGVVALLIASVLSVAVPSTPSIAADPPATFVLGVNLNGAAETIGGNAWRSYSAALGSGLSVVAPGMASTNVTPSPAVDPATARMLNTGLLHRSGNLSLAQTLPNGTYRIELYVMETSRNKPRSFDVRLEGGVVATAIGTLARGAWATYSYPVTVSDGSLNLELVRRTGDPHLMGFAIYTGGPP